MPALFFDFDGLILDTETPEIHAWEQEFARWGHILPQDYWARTIGRGADDVDEWPVDILRRLVPELPTDAEIEHRVETGRLARILSSPVLPGVRELMTAAREAGWRIGVVSSSMHSWVDPHLERLGLMPLVESTTCRGDTPRAKPYPDLYLLAQEKFRVTGGFAFEDSPNGARAALDAGLTTIVVPNPATRELDFPEGMIRLSSMTEVSLPFLEQIGREQLGRAEP